MPSLSSSLSKLITLTAFAGLNAALVVGYRQAVPMRDYYAMGLAVLVVVATLAGKKHRPEGTPVLQWKLYKKWFPVLSLLELVVFLVTPWALLLLLPVNKHEDDDAVVLLLARVLGSHLFIVQSQIALESVLRDGKTRSGCFWFIAVTTLYRGVGIATWVRRYYCAEILDENKDEILLLPSHIRVFMGVFTALAPLVWLSASAFIVLVWYPCVMATEAKALLSSAFQGAVVIVTGGASGIGRALCEELAAQGARAMVVVDRQAALAEEVAAQYRRRGAGAVEAKVYGVDVRNFAEVERVVKETKETYGRLDYIFNNAGVIVMGPIDKIGVENFDYILDVNVRGVHHGIQAALPIMKEQGFGHIVNVSSLLGLIPFGEWGVAYSASKHAVVGLSTNLRIEAAKHGVRVSVFCPGSIDTPIHRGGAYGKNLTGIPREVWDAQLAKAHFMDVKECAAQALMGVAKNESIIIVPQVTWMGSRLLYRLSPSLWIDRAIKKKAAFAKKLGKSHPKKRTEKDE